MPDSEDSASLTNLNIKRGVVKRKLNYIQNFVNDYQPENKGQINNRIGTLKALYSEFFEIQCEIEQVEAASNKESSQGQAEEFDTRYNNILAQLQVLSIDEPVPSISTVQDIQVKLPTINLPSFGGSYAEWTPFYDTFQALIDSNHRLSEIQKYHYLKSCLKDSASRIVECLPVSASSYAVAWTTLQTRFNNKRLIAQEHINAIIHVPQVEKNAHTSLRRFSDTVQVNIESLRKLQVDTDNWGPILISILTEKLDFFTKKDWQSALTTELPKLDEFLTFLDKRCQLLESLQSENKGTTAPKPAFKQAASKSNYHTFKQQATTYATHVVNSCNLCEEQHPLHACEKFLKFAVQERTDFIKSKRLCFNCFKSNHRNIHCKSSTCRKCGRKHNTLLHATEQIQTNQVPENSQETEAAGSQTAQLTTVNAANICTSNVLLPTAVVKVLDCNGKAHHMRILLDSASQLNLISRNAARQLNLPTRNQTIPVIGINKTVKKLNGATSWTIHSTNSKFNIKMDGFIIDSITTNIPNIDMDLINLKMPQGIYLADPKFDEARSVDILAGAGIFWELVNNGRIHLGRNHPVLQETKLGWVISGVTPVVPANKGQAEAGVCNFTSELQQQINRFWELEDYGNKSPLSADERQCEDIFVKTHSRTAAGNYVVKLPFKEDAGALGSCYKAAQKRLFALENKFQRDKTFQQQYRQVMSEYVTQGHIERVPINELQKQENVYYLPHHAVIKDSTTTPLRPVFDASCKSTSGTSLNDHLLIGPKLQDNLFGILARFRKHKVALTADIEKMYFQVEVHPEHKDFQRLLWRTESNKPIEIYRLRKVTFGTSSASYLAVRALQQLATDEAEGCPLLQKTIKQDFYMDDLITGANSYEDAIELKNSLTHCLLKGGFKLRKWASNIDVIKDNQVQGNEQNELMNLIKDNTSKTLGMMWDRTNDTFFYTIRIDEAYCPTKRSVLSIIARLYDPLGWINPVIVTAKIILQRLWVIEVDWDDEIPKDLALVWKQFLGDLTHINDIKIPRKVIGVNNPELHELHCFCDASQKAYGAAIYVRTINGTEVSNKLLCAKSRVAPVKTVALARLELCGAVLLCRLLKSVTEIIDIEIASITCWTDSTIVLNWIAKQPSTLETFVANRVAEIQETTKRKDWNYIPSKLNPCDILSRGCTALELKDDKLWSDGPHFLQNTENEWPKPPDHTLIKTEQILLTTTEEFETKWDVLERFSSFSKLTRVTAYCLRFINNLKKKTRNTNNLTTDELNHARTTIFRNIQEEHFHDERKTLEKRQEVSTSSKLSTLSPFIDLSGLIRLGGRLANSDLPYSSKHPIVLPRNSHITKLIIDETHVQQLHAGPQATLCAVRTKYWPLGGRSSVRQIINKCVKCFKAKPKTLQELMGNLPSNRVLAQIRPFINTAVDYAGPIQIKDGKGRGRKVVKCYIALFLCLSSKAIHLELVSDCTSESFIHALKRFIARRGKPTTILSDNATTFKGADNELQKIMKSLPCQSYFTQLRQEDIKFSFIPPRSPHFGGIYEAGIKSVKHHLKRVTGNNGLDYEEMHTVLTLIESCLNSRPITPLSSSPSDLDALTPGHLLIGAPLTSTPERDIAELKVTTLSRWQRVEQARQHFWRRWVHEYVPQLQQRLKWKTSSQHLLHVGSMVLLHEENVPPMQWALGRVEALHPGKDGKVRVVSVRVKSGVVKRAINRICLLPIDD